MNSNKFRMVYKVDGNPQLDSRDWSMYSNIFNRIEANTHGTILKANSHGAVCSNYWEDLYVLTTSVLFEVHYHVA